MRDVVLDTNVLVSALLTETGKPAEILSLFQNEKIGLYYSDGILHEYNEVLRRPVFRFDVDHLQKVLDDIQKFGRLVFPLPLSRPFEHEDDRIFYETAVQTKSYLVTGNKKHFPVEPFIVSPAEFLEIQ